MMQANSGLAVSVFRAGLCGALAADLTANGPLTCRGATARKPVTFDLHVSGSTLTGKVTTARGDTDIANGKVDGDTISLRPRSMNMQGNEMKMTYTGKADGDTIKFSRAMGDRPAMEFVAKKAAVACRGVHGQAGQRQQLHQPFGRRAQDFLRGTTGARMIGWITTGRRPSSPYDSSHDLPALAVAFP